MFKAAKNVPAQVSLKTNLKRFSLSSLCLSIGVSALFSLPALADRQGVAAGYIGSEMLAIELPDGSKIFPLYNRQSVQYEVSEDGEVRVTGDNDFCRSLTTAQCTDKLERFISKLPKSSLHKTGKNGKDTIELSKLVPGDLPVAVGFEMDKFAGRNLFGIKIRLTGSFSDQFSGIDSLVDGDDLFILIGNSSRTDLSKDPDPIKEERRRQRGTRGAKGVFIYYQLTTDALIRSILGR